MTSKSLIALAFVCLTPAIAFAETAPAKVAAPAAPAAVTAPAVSAPATATVKAAPAVVPAAATAPAATTPAGTTAAVPADGPGSKRWQNCAGDIQKLCGTVEKGKGAVRTCLESHATELSAPCKTSMAEHAATHAAKPAEKAATDKVVK